MPDSRLCLWTTDTASFDIYYVTGEGVEAWKSGSRRSAATPTEPLSGYPVYQLEPALAPGDCNIIADVHSGQYVNVDVTPDQDGATDPCRFAREVMTSVLSNLGK
jgi:uncharacterized protein DUF3558